MTDLSVRTFLQTELQRLREWLTETPDSLDAVDTIATVGDYIEPYSIPSRLPDGWHVECDMVQFGDESLAEVVRLTDSGDGYRITLKPVDVAAPTDRIELYTRRSPFDSRQHRTTVGSLTEAITAAAEIAATHQERGRESAATR
ncbi:hypothetical protein halTADL_0980 [Halohasta litchfieldiae]|jgi:hypothetical protein|uniref:Uncharacterized protein n=1 Tax=Halohasta litchfieldiae TaxID=1073996 RepID=A0A1H6TEI6_9EURY|nr:hypothetical protein [Halohasta litchfieldiae]ATW87775.1 hypothetical protein halTADL_0980 [Halohasta litchfieldiae]SEI74192.1 hypothetical protein SAMN05444271_1071 [Halohasta litchfieldiae]